MNLNNHIIKIISICFVFIAPSCPKKSYEFYLEQGKIECANTNTYVGITLFTKAIKLKPNYEEAYMQRAKAYIGIDSIGKAVSDYDTIVSWHKDDQEQLGKLYLLIGDTYRKGVQDSLACTYWKMARDMNNTTAWDKIRKYCK